MFCETVCPPVVAAVAEIPITLAPEVALVVVEADARFLIVLPIIEYNPPVLPGAEIPTTE
jgi:hypothetical protein